MNQIISPIHGVPYFNVNPFGWSDEYLAKLKALIGRAIVYDVETTVKAFTLNAESIDSDDNYTWEISHRRNDIVSLMQWFNLLHQHKVDMIGYNNLHFDYPVIHNIFMNAGSITVEDIYAHAQHIIGSQDRFGSTIWQDQRFAPQIDLYKIHHFDNKAKRQSLKGLEFNMRSHSVLDMPVDFREHLSAEQIDRYLVPYNRHDVKETKNFALISAEAIAFRREMASQIEGDVINFNDTKLGKELLIQRIGANVCYSFTPRKAPKQTIRTRVDMAEVVFPYISFDNPEFIRVLTWIKQQVLTSYQLENLTGEDGEPIEQPERFSSEPKSISTKGVFKDVSATISNFTFHFGTGGIHGSVSNQRWTADEEYMLEDIDVASLYPSVAIVNKLYPEHLGERFFEEYSGLKAERFKYDKKTAQNGALKLALNGSYGDSGNEFSPLLDKQFLLKITINGQLMLCMLAERLMRVPTLQMIQINTDGMTYRVHRSMKEVCARIHAEWERFTMLDLEKAYYSRMWVRDVNNYVAESEGSGKLKLKGAYWYADGTQFEGGWTEAVSKAGPSAWHKDLSAHVVQRAAVAAMVHGCDPLHFLHCWRDPFDYMLRAKAPKGATLYIGPDPVQKITRYFISKDGGSLHKIAMPKGEIGQYKRANKLDDAFFDRIMSEIGPNVHDPRIHTKNKSKYEMTDTAYQSGYLVSECNLSSQFSFDRLNYQWYETEAKKLIIG